MGFVRPSTPVTYPVNDTSIPEPERGYLAKLAERASRQDMSEDLRPYVRDISIAFTVFAAAFVGLRFLARYRQAARIGVDDYLILVALAFLVGNMTMNLVLIDHGLGLHSGALTLPELQQLDQTIVGAEIIYVAGVNMYKLSLLFFYFRVFPLRVVRIGGYICGGISTAWCVACILAATFQCTPRERLWKPWAHGTCINLFLTQLCISVPSILCDVGILCLPLPHVLRLKTNLTQRILLMFVFLLGSYVVFTSIYRFRIFLAYTTDDVPYSLAQGCAWNVVEISSGIVSACLPTLGPIIRDVFKSAWPSSRGGSKTRSQPNGSSTLMTIGGTGARKLAGSNGGSSRGSAWNRLTDSVDSRDDAKYGVADELELVPRNMGGSVQVDVRASGGHDAEHGRDLCELGAITQRTDVEWKVVDRDPTIDGHHMG